MQTPSHIAARLIKNGYNRAPCVKKRPIVNDWLNIACRKGGV